MKTRKLYYFFVFFLCCSNVSYSQINTGVVVLDQNEQLQFRKLRNKNPDVAVRFDSLKKVADSHLATEPKPLKTINYEGLLDTDPNRIESIKGLLDANKVVDLIYVGYGSNNDVYGEKIKEIVLAWSDVYEPTGNPINENKLTPFFWGYHTYQHLFSHAEKQKVESWMLSIATKELERKNTPNNNWQAKRLKIIGFVGCIIDNKQLQEFTLNGIKKYISTSYYPDGTSNDLKKRDAMHYHLSGIEPLLDIFINLQKFNTDFDLYSYEDSSGTSIKGAIDYCIPYISGEKTRKEWVNSKVELDRQRAAAGLEKYQPGKLFNPRDAIPMLNWAVYYNSNLFEYICGSKDCFTCNIEALLNSPAIRGQ